MLIAEAQQPRADQARPVANVTAALLLCDMDVEKAIRSRRTHKAFGRDPVGADLLEELFELARWAPNHHLTNPWRFRVLGEGTRERLMALAESEQPGSAVKLQRAPTLVAVTALLSGEPAQDREDELATGVAAYLVLLGAHARGLAGYWRTVPLLEDPRGREILGLGVRETPVGLLYIGRPVQEQRVPERAPLQELVTYLD
jgi:nitroreductase